MKSVLLIHPPQSGLMEGFSAGLISLANYLSQHESTADVRLVDLGLCGPDDLSQALTTALQGSYRTVTVGISTTTASYQAALRVASAVKQLRPDAFVTLGGHHASPEAEVILTHHRQIDAIVRGEGEIALLRLVRDLPSLDHVPNLVYRTHLGLKQTSPAPLLDQVVLDKIGPVFPGGMVRSAPGKFDHVTYVSARGCPLRCSFCAVANQAIRTKSITKVSKDITTLAMQNGFRRIAIEDNFFAHSRQRTLELCAALEDLRKTVPFTWDCQTRVESLARPGIIDAMARAGCEAVYVGVEALHPDLLAYLGKTPKPDTYLRTLTDVVVPRLLASPIACYINIQFGIPGETDMQRHFLQHNLTHLGQLASSSGKVITLFPQLAVLYPGTAHFENAVKERRFGSQTREVFESFTEWESRRQPILDWMGVTFAHGTGGIPEGILDEYELHHGRFSVDGEAVLRVLKQLRTAESLAGIRLFRYGEYLANPHTRPQDRVHPC